MRPGKLTTPQIELDIRFPNWSVWVENVFVTLHDDGSFTIYSDSDVTLTLKQAKEITRLLDRFVYARTRSATGL